MARMGWSTWPGYQRSLPFVCSYNRFVWILWVYPDRLGTDDRRRSEIVLKRFRWPLVERFVRANRIDKVLFDSPVRKLGIVTQGKAVQDARQALKQLGLGDETAATLGISFHKMGCIHPVEREGLCEFATDQQELLFIEEKEPLTENQSKALLYGRPGAPLIVGK